MQIEATEKELMYNKVMYTNEAKKNGTPSVECVAVEVMNAEWCVNCVEEAIHFIEMSGLQGKLLDTIQDALPQYCRDVYADKLQDLGVWDCEIEYILRNRNDFETFEDVKDYVLTCEDIGDMTLDELDEVSELCVGEFVMVDGEVMSLIDFLNLDMMTLREFMDIQSNWGHSDDPLAWHLTSHLNLDSFFDVYGEDANGQWTSPEWDGSKRIAPEDRQSTVEMMNA